MFGVFTGLTTVILYHADKDSFTDQVNSMYNNTKLPAWATIYALTWAVVVIEFIASLATGQLMIFHIWLMKRGITTLEYMVANKEDIFKDKLDQS